MQRIPLSRPLVVILVSLTFFVSFYISTYSRKLSSDLSVLGPEVSNSTTDSLNSADSSSADGDAAEPAAVPSTGPSVPPRQPRSSLSPETLLPATSPSNIGLIPPWDPNLNYSYWRAAPDIPHQFSNQPCPFDHVDFVVPFTGRREMMMVDYLMKSIMMFVPCYRQMHIIVPNEDDYKAIDSVIPPVLANVFIHIEVTPPEIKEFYLQMQWGQFWTDNYTDAEYVMFLDSDVFFAYPMTCQATFDSSGRSLWPYYDGWDIYNKSFTRLMSNGVYLGDFMSVFPITVHREGQEFSCGPLCLVYVLLHHSDLTHARAHI
jgi:hypothetical protein